MRNLSMQHQVRFCWGLFYTFIYSNSSWRLNYFVGGEITTMFHLDRPMYLLGYLANQSRVYLIDKEFNVMGYTLLLSLIEYKTCDTWRC
ncbi:hypothetical protein ACHQM5_007490 [Ranunculus cassubicifolius]